MPSERADKAEGRSRLTTIKNEMLAGLTTSFAMVPEVVAFAFVAGVNPLVGLYAAFVVGLITAAWGGRPGMISGGAGSLAVVSVALVASHGVGYLFAAVLLMGCIQVLVGVLGWGKFIRLVPHPVMLGFVNGLAVVILMAQVRQFEAPSPGGDLPDRRRDGPNPARHPRAPRRARRDCRCHSWSALFGAAYPDSQRLSLDPRKPACLPVSRRASDVADTHDYFALCRRACRSRADRVAADAEPD